jgi:hypothetical protein
MATTVNEARAIGTVGSVEQTEVSDGLRLARYSVLDEMSGLVYAFLTLTWIVLSLTGLAL